MRKVERVYRRRMRASEDLWKAAWKAHHGEATWYRPTRERKRYQKLMTKSIRAMLGAGFYASHCEGGER